MFVYIQRLILGAAHARVDAGIQIFRGTFPCALWGKEAMKH